MKIDEVSLSERDIIMLSDNAKIEKAWKVNNSIKSAMKQNHVVHKMQQHVSSKSKVLSIRKLIEEKL